MYQPNLYKMDNPKDHEGLFFGCNEASGYGETKNGTIRYQGTT